MSLCHFRFVFFHIATHLKLAGNWDALHSIFETIARWNFASFFAYNVTEFKNYILYRLYCHPATGNLTIVSYPTMTVTVTRFWDDWRVLQDSISNMCCLGILNEITLVSPLQDNVYVEDRQRPICVCIFDFVSCNLENHVAIFELNWTLLFWVLAHAMLETFWLPLLT